jgi:hypothetical protein
MFADRLGCLLKQGVTGLKSYAPWFRLGEALGRWVYDDYLDGPNEDVAFDGVIRAAEQTLSAPQGNLAVVRGLAHLSAEEGSGAPASLRERTLANLPAELRPADWLGAEKNSWVFSRTVYRLSGSIADGLLTLPKRTEPPQQLKPHWDRASGRLYYGGQQIRQVRMSKAENIVAVLDAFEAAGWPESIPDPSKHDQENLHYTIRSLNEGLRPALIRFRSDGSGRGFGWDVIPSPADR